MRRVHNSARHASPICGRDQRQSCRPLGQRRLVVVLFIRGTVTLRGFAIDRASAAGAGIDRVDVYLDGPYGTGTIIGAATYGLDRPDVAAQYGARFGPSGWELVWDTAGIAPGVHRLYLYAHRTTNSAWSLMDPHLVIVAGGHGRWLPLVLRQP